MKKLLLAAFVLFATSSFAAVDAFLKIDGVKGESTDTNHKDWIELTSFSLGTQPGGSATAAAATQTAMNRATFRARSGAWQPQVMQAVGRGTHFQKVIADVGPTHYTFTDVMFTGVSSGGGGGGAGLPEETITFVYGHVETTYTPQRTPEPPKSSVAASMVNPNVTPAPTTAQLFVNGAPVGTFEFISLHSAGPNTAVLKVREAASGFFRQSSSANTRKLATMTFLRFKFGTVFTTKISWNSDGSEDVTLSYATYEGPALTPR